MSGRLMSSVPGALGVVGFLALLQFILHPVLSGGSVWTWATFWLYTTFGVIVPGTLLATRTLAWRADWLGWLGVGWALGHAMELIALLLARQLGDGRLGLLWIVIVYAFAFVSHIRGRPCRGRIDELPDPWRGLVSLSLLFTLGAGAFFAISVPEISTAPPFVSDPWFHVGNAHEFRDHAPMQDPRLAGDPFNYHVFGYAASAAASLATGEGLAPIMLRYSGMACVFLFILNLFNVGRSLRSGGIVAGAIGAAFAIFPVELGRLVAPGLDFDAGLAFFGIYLSTTTLAGQVFLVPLLILLREYYRGGEERGEGEPESEAGPEHDLGGNWQNAWAIGLFAFAGAGSKAMFGPVVLCAAAGVAGWRLLMERRLDPRLLRVVGVLALAIAPPTMMLIFGEGSYSQSLQWIFGAFPRRTGAFETLVGWGVPESIAIVLWLFGFCAPILLGAILGSVAMRRRGEDGNYVVFVWMSLVAALVPALGIELLGQSQLFFLYYALTALATLAGAGWMAFIRSRFALRTTAVVCGLWILSQALLGFGGRLSMFDPRVDAIWGRSQWWPHAVTHRDRLMGSPRQQPASTSPYERRISLTPGIEEGLDWARRNLPADAAFAVNVQSASVYGALSESRAFLDAANFSVRSHVARSQGAARGIFAPRRAKLDAWVQARPGFVAGLTSAGVTHLFVDRVNGRLVPIDHPDLGEPIFENTDFVIFDLGRAGSPDRAD